MPIPAARHRRLRESALLRDLVRETRLSADDLAWPLFVAEGLRGTPPKASAILELWLARMRTQAA